MAKLTPRHVTDLDQLEQLPGEAWVVIQSHPNYTLSNYGRVISYAKKYPILLSPQTDAIGYQHYRLFKKNEEGKSVATLWKVHRLVATYFLVKPENIEILEVNHKDGIKDNNHVSNLEWVTKSTNMQHAFMMGLKVKHGRFGKRIPVEVFDSKGRSLGKYNTMMDAGFMLGIPEITISNWYRGVRSQKGYTVVGLDKIGEYANPLSSLSPRERAEKIKYKEEYIKSLNQNKQ